LFDELQESCCMSFDSHYYDFTDEAGDLLENAECKGNSFKFDERFIFLVPSLETDPFTSCK